MKVIHIPFCYYPDAVGGTEIYVQALARSLQAYGVNNIIAAPASKSFQYLIDDIPVFRYALSELQNDLYQLYGTGDPRATAEFETILDSQEPNLVNFHAFTRGVSLNMIRSTKRRGIPVVFTYHTPTVSCNRGTLMRWGIEVCDGQLQRVRCTRCVLHSSGLNRTTSKLIGALPPCIGTVLGKLERQGGIWTALRMSELITLRHATTRALFAEVDHIVVVANWIREVLLRNGVPEQKITLCRHGLAHGNRKSAINQNVQVCKQLRLIFLGRLDETKGIDIVLRAFQMLPDASVTLDIYGIQQEKEKTPYQKKLLEWIEKDSRVSLHPPVASEQVISLLQNYDSLVVPSRWLETGPLVVLEAFAAGIPVVGSKLGGIAEWVEDDVNGLLVEVDSPRAWAQTLERLIDNPKLAVQLASNITTPRTMNVVASEMLALYKTVVNSNK